MTKIEYQQTQQTLLSMIPLVATMPLEEFIQAINSSETLGPILDPTLYMKAGDNLKLIKKLAIALRGFQLEIEDQAGNIKA